MINIEMASDIIRSGAMLPTEDRDAVETSKAQHGVDDSIAPHLVKIAANFGKTLDITSVIDEIYLTLDIALILLAYCANEKDIQYVYDKSILLGRRHNSKNKVRINIIDLSPRLANVFNEIAKVRGLHRYGENDLSMTRRKVKAALNIIQESLDHSKTR